MRSLLVAPDSFKGSASAAEAARWISQGWRMVNPNAAVIEVPLADGGEGTLDAIAAAQRGTTTMTCHVPPPVPGGPWVQTRWLMLSDGTGVIELADAAGIGRIPRPAPMTASTVGLGHLIVAALDAGCRRLLIGLGGSGSNDGGVGALGILGALFQDRHGAPIAPGAQGLSQLASVDLRGLRALPPDGVVLLGDVRNPLLGPDGAAAIFGPQKGASPREVAVINDGLDHLVAAARRAGRSVDPDLPGAGSAGGTGYGLALWGATIHAGAPMIAEMNDLRGHIERSQLVISGEGQFDDQSIQGKLVGHVIELAASAGVPVAIVTGQRAIDEPSHPSICASIALSEMTSAQEAIADPQRWIIQAGRQLAEIIGSRSVIVP